MAPAAAATAEQRRASGDALPEARAKPPTFKSVAHGVLARIRVLSAFTSLRHQSNVSDLLDFAKLRFVRRLGAGAFGEVALFRWQPGTTFTTADGLTLERQGTLAVKSLLPSVTRDPVAVADFRAEVQLLSKLAHSCLVVCYGTGLRPPNKGSHGLPMLFVAMESVTGGDLRSIVVRAMNGAPRVYRNADVVRWAHDMARGLHYLHTRTPMIVHRDLKLENVLLDERWSAKLTDFGLAKSILTTRETEASVSHRLRTARLSTAPLRSYAMTGGTGSYKYMAPESFLSSPCSERMDQYSYAILLWELMARRLLLSPGARVNGVPLNATAEVWAARAAKEGARPDVPDKWPEEMREIIKLCWSPDASKRPRFQRVKERLKPLLQPHLFTDPVQAAKVKEEAACCSFQ